MYDKRCHMTCYSLIIIVMNIKTAYSIRILLTANLVVFLIWCLILLTRRNFQPSMDSWKPQYLDLKKMEMRLDKLKHALINHFPSQIEYINAHIMKDMPTIYAITPTYARWTQKADLTRLSQTLLHVPNFRWIVVEDSEDKTTLVTNFLKYSGLQYTHLNAKTDVNFKLKSDDPNWLLPRGVSQRNTGLEWIRKNVPPSTSGVLYFLDDDNTYSIKLFEEMRTTIACSAWPVGLSGGLKFEGPGTCKNGKVLSWYTAWKPDRPFPIDMAGFAVNLKLVFKFPKAAFSNTVPRGYLESHFLTSLKLSRDDVEAKADDCSKIFVWHTRTEKSNLKHENKLIQQGRPSNPDMEV